MTIDLSQKEDFLNHFVVKLQDVNDSASTISSLKKINSEHEETLEKLRDQRERMLNKMKEMKINNESLTDQVRISSFHSFNKIYTSSS